MSLRWRIAIAVATLAAIATLVVGLAGYRSTRDRLYAEVDRSLADASQGPYDRRDANSQIEGPMAGRGVPTLYEVQWIDSDGTVRSFPGSPELPVTRRASEVVGRPNRSALQTVTADGTQYRVRTTGLPDGARQIARSLEETNRVLRSLRARTVVTVVAVTAVAALLGSLIAGRVTASLRRLTAVADTVRSTGRLDVDVPSDGTDEVSRLGASFGAMLGALARSRAEQQRLVEDAGHELKTPLTSIRTNLDVLRRHPDLPAADRTQVVRDLHDEVEEMVDLVDEIVAVAGGVAGDEPATTFSLGDLAADVVDRYQRRTGRRFDVDTDDSPVHAQPAAVQRAISNLLDNAAKFDSSDGTIVVRVREGSVEVLDRGSGIAAHELALVFERFHRGAEARSLPGSGLGLSIVSDVVGRNGGTTHAAPREGGGAAVGFTLPLAVDRT